MVYVHEFSTFRIPFCIYLKLFFPILNDENRRKQKHTTKQLYTLIVPQLVCFYQIASLTTTEKNDKHRSAVGIITLYAHSFFLIFFVIVRCSCRWYTVVSLLGTNVEHVVYELKIVCYSFTCSIGCCC